MTARKLDRLARALGLDTDGAGTWWDADGFLRVYVTDGRVIAHPRGQDPVPCASADEALAVVCGRAS